MGKTKDLRSVVTEFRAALLLTEPSDFIGTSLSASKFPDACCDDASMLLAAYLVDNGFTEIDIMRGEYGGDKRDLPSHVWLQIDQIFIDITADQFNRLGYENPPVICEEKNSFLSSFSAKNEGNADFREHILKYNDQDLLAAFESGYEIVKSKIEV